MKILFLQNTAAISPILSGGEIRLYRIYKFLNSRHECKMMGFFSSKTINNELGIEAETISRFTLYDKFSIYFAYLLKTIDLIFRFLVFRFKCDIIYSSSDFFPDVIPAFIYKSFFRKTKWVQCIFHVYSDWRIRPGNKFINFIAEHLQKLSFILIRFKSDHVIVINNGTRSQLIHYGFQPNRVKQAPCGVDINYLNKLPASERIFDGLFIGRLHPTKGIFDLLKIWKIVVESRPSAKLGIVGAGAATITQDLKGKIQEMGLKNNIELLGGLENNVAFSLLKSSKTFLFPSHEEGWGIAIAEAMACRVPVVAWDLNVYSEVFENYLIQISEGNYDSFAKKILFWLMNEDEGKKYSEQAYKFISKFDWDNVGFQEETNLKNLLTETPGGK